MTDFRHCTNENYNIAMTLVNADVRDVPTAQLYILYTQWKSDAVAYARKDRDRAAKAREKKRICWAELSRRKLEA